MRNWDYEPDNDACFAVTPSDDPGMTICEVYTDETDARLIAAAPDLLQTCQALMTSLEGSGYASKFPMAVSSLRAVIAKATGQEG